VSGVEIVRPVSAKAWDLCAEWQRAGASELRAMAVLSVAQCAYCSLQVASMHNARHAPCLADCDRPPQDAQLADPQPPPERSTLQRAIIRVGRQRIACKHVSHRAQSRSAILGMELS
jgi:hypothetical protein